jgi:hypothetical protein
MICFFKHSWNFPFQVLDDEAEVFMVKLWRLIVYESEAKRLGLNVLPSGKSTS